MTDILVTNDFFAFIKDLFSRTTYTDNPCYIYICLKIYKKLKLNKCFKSQGTKKAIILGKF